MNPAQGQSEEVRELLTTLSEALRRYRFETIDANRPAVAPNPDGAASTAETSELGLLVQLFSKCLPVSLASFERFLAPLRAHDLAAAGLVRIDDEMITPLCRIEAHDHLFLLSDAGPERADYVTRVTKAAETLAHLTVRRPVARMLDIGTGSGIQALLAARHAEVVVATDVNARALAYVTMNAQLNGLSNLEVRQGSCFEPVGNEYFDLVVCNPPYVISPDSTFLYRDAPADICRKLAAEIPRHLNVGGFATMLVNWVHDGSWSEPLREWVKEAGCEVLLIHYATTPCAEYAALWNQEFREKQPGRFEESVKRWMDYYRESGIRWIASGAIVFHRALNGPSQVRMIEATNGPHAASGEHLQRLFAANYFLNAIQTDRDFLDCSFALVDDHRIDQTIRRENGQYIAEPAVLRIVPGMGIEVRIDARVLELLFGLDGRPLRKQIRGIARARDEDESEFTKLAIANMRRLVELGFAIPKARNGN